MGNITVTSHKVVLLSGDTDGECHWGFHGGLSGGWLVGGLFGGCRGVGWLGALGASGGWYWRGAGWAVVFFGGAVFCGVIYSLGAHSFSVFRGVWVFGGIVVLLGLGGCGGVWGDCDFRLGWRAAGGGR